MTGFVITADPPVTAEEPNVINDGWFPDFAPAAVRDACRLDGTVTAQRLRPALQDAMLSVNAELQAWAEDMRATYGAARLEEVPSATVGGESAKVLHYRRAVHHCLMADMTEAYRNLSTLPEGNGKADRVQERLVVQVDEYRQKQRWAIADLQGTRRCIVDLL